MGNDSNNNSILSQPSESVIVIDTPITSANGKSSGTRGNATLNWENVSDVLNADAYAGGTYWFRYRRASAAKIADHSAITWLPNEDYFSISTEIDESQLDSGNTIGDLELFAVYAIQLWYKPLPAPGNQPARHRVYSARDVYVWPSTRAGGDGTDDEGIPYAGERVASYPLNYPIENTRSAPTQTYVYRLCTDTYPTLDLSDDHRKASWPDFIFDAFDRWRVATDGLVVAVREHVPCAKYSAVVEQVVQSLARSLEGSLAAQYDENTRRAHVQALVDQSRHVATLRDAVLRAAM